MTHPSTSETSGRTALWIIVGLLLYALSPPVVYKVSEVTGIPLSEKVFVTVYAPLFPVIEYVKPYALLIQAEAKLLNL